MKVKLTRKRSAATPHATFDVAGNGNQDMVRPLKALLLRKRGENRLAIPKSMAPFLDPTEKKGIYYPVTQVTERRKKAWKQATNK